MTTLADIHNANTANEVQMHDLLGQLGTQQTAMTTAINAGDMDGIKAALTSMWQTTQVLSDAMMSTLSEDQLTAFTMAAVDAGAVQSVTLNNGSNVTSNGVVSNPLSSGAVGGYLPVVSGGSVVSSGGATVDTATGQTTVSSGGQVTTSPAPTGQMPIGTTTGLQPVPGTDVSVPTEGDPVATAQAKAAMSSGSVASSAPLVSGGGSGVVVPDGGSADGTATVAGGNVTS